MRRQCLAFAILLSTPAFASADLVLDQQHDPTVSFTGAVTNGPNYVDEDEAQTFTVGVTGILTRIEVRIGRGGGFGEPSGNLRLDVRPTLSGIPLGDGTELAIATIPGTDAPNTFPNYTWAVVTGLSVPVLSGQQLAIVLQNMGTNYYGWASNFSPGYGAGSVYYRQLNGSWQSINGFDNAFRTFVTVVPEAGSFLLLSSLTAAAAVLAACRKRFG